MLANTAYRKFQPRSFNLGSMLFTVDLAFGQRTSKRANRHLPYMYSLMPLQAAISRPMPTALFKDQMIGFISVRTDSAVCTD